MGDATFTVIPGGSGAMVLRGSNGNVFSTSDFGLDESTFGPDFDPSAITDSERYRSLDFCPVSYTHLTLPTNREV